jgi:helicase
MPEKRVIEVKQESSDATLNICLDTLARGKQALVFCNTKRGAESQAERTSQAVESTDPHLLALSEEILNVLATPTKQCKRLAFCIKKGVAFHHAGLHAKQRELIENNFREGLIKIICSTPTLSMGLDLPAFRVVIRDLKRFSETGAWGMTDIPVLEYHQMAGRAGRPGMESYGEAIILAETEEQKEERREKYILGEPEEIYSKLAVEPVLRTYVLSLIAGEFVTSRKGLHEFFERTFYAKQYGDTRKLRSILDAMVEMLAEWEFLAVTGDQHAPHGEPGAARATPRGASLFVSAKELLKQKDGALKATPLGRRVAELYLDPFTGHFLITCLQRATSTQPHDFAVLQMLTSCLELRPLLRPRVRELDEIVEKTNPYLSVLLVSEPVQYSSDYEEFLMTLKTALFLKDWVEEIQEAELLERYGVGPGEVHVKLERADWLLYAAEELARLLSLHQLRAPLAKMRLRLKHGAKEELLPLLQLKNIGRVRARKLFHARIRTLGDVKEADVSTLAALLGRQISLDVKKQVGQDVSAESVRVKPHRRKGQTAMDDY